MTGADPIVSIVVPAWNAARYIGEALDSVRAQTLVGWEALVIDDCSTDDTVQQVAAMAAREPRIRLLRQAVNGGPSAARNRGFAEARGRFIALLDADDSYSPSRLADLVQLAERHGCEMASDNLLLMPEGSPETARPMIPWSVLSGERALELNEFVGRNVADPEHPGLNLGFLKPIFRREFLRSNRIRYDERVRFAEDFALYVDCLLAGARWWMIDAPNYRYRVRADSLTQIQTVHDLGILRAKLAGLSERARSEGDAALTRLVRRHARVVDRSYYYRAFTDHLKARRFGAAASELCASGRAASLICQESARQLPIIVRKATRGGYRAPTNGHVTEPPRG